MQSKLRSGLTLAAFLAACSPTTLPPTDAPSTDTPSADRADVPRPDSGVDTGVDTGVVEDTGVEQDVADVSMPPMDVADVSMPPMDVADVSMPPMDAADVATMPDSAPDSAMDGASGCALPTQPAITVPTTGTPTVITNTWAAGGMGSSISSYGCTSFGLGADHIYPLTITTRTTLQFVLTANVGALANPMMALRRVCNVSTGELACDLDSGPGNGSAFRATLDPGTYFLIAEDYASSAATARGGAYTLTVSAPADVPAGTCAGATAWMAGTTAAGSINSGGTADRSCNPTTATGPEVFFAYTLPANTRSTITATPLGAPPWRPYVRIRDNCTTTTCLVASAGASDGMPATATVENRSGVARTFIVSMGSYELGTGGAFTLTDSLMMLPPVPMNAVCATAPMVGPVSMLTGETTVGTFEQRSSSSCAAGVATGGTLAYYRMTVPAGRTMAATVTPEATFDPTIRIFVGCSPTTCSTYRNSFSTGVVEQASYRNTSAVDQEVIIAVGSSSTTGTGRFDLDARLLPAMPTNTSCATARPITPTMPAIAQDQSSASMPNTLATCEATATGNVLYYTVNVPAGQTAILRATAYTTTADAVLRVTDTCASMGCLASANTGFGGVQEEVFVTNGSATARDYIVTLGSRATTSAGVFDLSVRFTTLALNASCAMPRALSNGDSVMMQDTSTALERRSTGCSAASPTAGPLLYYQVTVPANRAGVVRVTPRGMFDPTIRVMATCTATSCVNYRNSVGAGFEEVQAISNTTAADVTYIVAIGGAGTGETGQFDLSFNLTAAMPTNTSCATARPLSVALPALLQNQGSATMPNTLTTCEATATGNVLYYSLNVPAGQTAIITATPLSTSVDPVIRVTDTCASVGCLASANSGSGGTSEQVIVTNPTMAARDYIVTLGSRATTSAGVTDLTVRFVTAPSNGSCSTATSIAPGTPIAMQDTGAAIERRTTGCLTTTTGAPLLYYTATVPANTTARVRVTPTGAFNPTVRVFQTCSPTACTAYRATAASGVIEEALWRNSAATAQMYTIAVGGTATNETGVFSIELDFPPDPYMVTRTMSATCDDVSTGTVLTDLVGDDSETLTLRPIGFSFSYFGDAVTHFGATTNGLLQLFPSAVGTTAFSYSNTDLVTPNADIPGGLAVFWDDLNVPATGSVRYALLGSGTARRFVIEWRNVEPLSGGGMMTFQAKLFEGSNLIEFHYCMTGGSTRATGDSASMGLVNVAASRSVGVSYLDAMGATTGTRYLFVPR
ncbi:MAG: hypothetical protein JNK05_39295 [Myxococcales bacterium]|nr:hypothetical protein [Myxococcales bacterium]